MDEQLFRLKFAVKQFQKSAQKCEKQSREEKLKVKRAMQQGNMDGARIFAQNSIRKHNEYLNHLRLSSRLDAVASRLDSAVKMNQITGTMTGVVGTLDKALGQMDVNRIATVMDTFEKQFEDMDVRSSYVEQAMGNSTALSTPDDQVESLMAEVADEHGLELSSEMGKAVPRKTADKSEEDLSERLKKLQGSK